MAQLQMSRIMAFTEARDMVQQHGLLVVGAPGGAWRAERNWADDPRY